MAYFRFRTPDQVLKEARALGVTLPFSQETDILRRPLDIGRFRVPNRLAVQPMEGCDGTDAGAPGELTVRRYRRFAAGGAGLIWVEATAILPEARANPRQLYLCPGTLAQFSALTEEIRRTAERESGVRPLLICQLTHSGRYSKPTGKPAPRILYHSPVFEGEHPLPDSCLVTDEELARLPQAFADAAVLARQAGFDGCDIKACHRYLLSESLSAYTRPGPYGGSFENRTRLFLDCMRAVRDAVGEDFLVCTRLNVYDGFPYPYGFGVPQDGSLTPDPGEACRLVKMLKDEFSVPLIDLTIGNPYVNPHVNRPYEQGSYPPPEHPLIGVARMCACVGAVRRVVPGVAVVGSGFSYLRQFSSFLAAGAVRDGVCDIAGFGRMAFADPDFPKQILQQGSPDPGRVCLTCGKCTDLMRAGTVTGCVVRDAQTYLPYYKEYVGNE